MFWKGRIFQENLHAVNRAFLSMGASLFLSKSPPAFEISKTSATPPPFSPSPSIPIDGEGRGRVLRLGILALGEAEMSEHPRGGL